MSGKLPALLGFVLFLVLPGSAFSQATEEEAKEAIKKFKEALKKCKEESDFVSALNDLGAVQHAKVLAELKPWMTKLPSNEIRLAAAENLSQYKKSKEAAEAILTALAAQKDKDVASKFISYAADTECKDIASKLCALFRSKEVDYAREAVDGCGKIKSKACIDPLIKLVMELEDVEENNNGAGQPNMPGPGTGGQGQEDERVKRKRELLQPALGALRAITDEKWVKGKEWLIWWNKNKATFKDPG